MNKDDLASKLAKFLNINKIKAKTIIDSILEDISDALSKSEKVTLAGFGFFEIKKRAARQGINPKTKESIYIGAKKIISFQPTKKLAGKIK